MGDFLNSVKDRLNWVKKAVEVISARENRSMKQHDNCKFCIGKINAKATGERLQSLGGFKNRKLCILSYGSCANFNQESDGTDLKI